MKRVPVSPRDVHVLVTAKCNLACKHCSIYGDGPIHGDLTTDQWRDIIGRLSAWKVLKLTVSGGEPLVREDFGEIVEAILSHPLRFSLNTNAMLVTDEVARLLGRATPAQRMPSEATVRLLWRAASAGAIRASKASSPSP